jgi:hypothetical protein
MHAIGYFDLIDGLSTQSGAGEARLSAMVAYDQISKPDRICASTGSALNMCMARTKQIGVFGDRGTKLGSKILKKLAISANHPHHRSACSDTYFLC